MANWQSQGGTWITAPCAVRVDPYRLALFAVGTDHAVHARWRTPSGWGAWESLGGIVVAAPFAVSRGDGTVDLFCVSHDHSVSHRSWNGRAWGAWQPLHCEAGGAAITAPHTVWSGPDEINAFVLATNLEVRHLRRTGDKWHTLAPLGGPMASAPQVISRLPGQLDVFATGADGRVHHQATGPQGWTGWQPISESRATSRPCPVACGPDRCDVYFLGTDRMLYRQSWQGEWTEPSCLEGTIVDQPRAAWLPERGTDIFVVGEDRSIWHRTLLGSGTTWWRSLGGQAYSDISLVVHDKDRVELFVLGRDSAVWHRTLALS